MKREVLDHYDNLADEFDRLSNKYCNSRYLKVLEGIIKPSDAVLEIGCGTGKLLSGIDGKIRVGCDISGNLLHQRREKREAGFSLVQADAENLPFKSGRFDVCYSINMLEHVPHPERVVMEGLRALKRGGRIILITPNGDMGWLLEIADALRLKAPEGPHKFLTTSALKRIIGQSGLGIRIVKLCKIVLVPSGPGFLINAGEKFEPGLSGLCFFHLAVLEKL